MPASLLASFISFLIVGLYTWFNLETDLDDFVITNLFIAVLANSIFFFYFEALTELEDEYQENLQDKGQFEWGIRIFNQALLFSLWFLLDLGIGFFCIGLITLYVSFLLWGAVTKFSNGKLLALDAVGCFFSFVFVFFLLSSSEDITPLNFLRPDGSTDLKNYGTMWALVSTAFLLIPIFGMVLTEFKLFDKKYFRRPEARFGITTASEPDLSDTGDNPE